MRIVDDTGNRMLLRGVPHGAPWMIFAAVFGLIALGACLAFGVGIVSRPRSSEWLALVPLSFGALLGLAFVVFGAVQLASRETLELSRTSGRAEYRLWTLLVGERKRLSFALADIRAVSLEAYTVKGHGRGSFPRPALRARLLLAMPRREAIELDDTQNGREARVRGLATRVAAFLSVELRETDVPASARGTRRPDGPASQEKPARSARAAR